MADYIDLHYEGIKNLYGKKWNVGPLKRSHRKYEKKATLFKKAYTSHHPEGQYEMTHKKDPSHKISVGVGYDYDVDSSGKHTHYLKSYDWSHSHNGKIIENGSSISKYGLSLSQHFGNMSKFKGISEAKDNYSYDQLKENTRIINETSTSPYAAFISKEAKYNRGEVVEQLDEIYDQGVFGHTTSYPSYHVHVGPGEGKRVASYHTPQEAKEHAKRINRGTPGSEYGDGSARVVRDFPQPMNEEEKKLRRTWSTILKEKGWTDKHFENLENSKFPRYMEDHFHNGGTHKEYADAAQQFYKEVEDDGGWE